MEIYGGIMNRFVGLSLMCLVFASTQADSDQGEFKGSSWVLRMSQNSDGPINVEWEGVESDETGVVSHKKSRGVVVDGVYRPIKGKDSKNSFKKSFSESQKNDEELSADRERFLEKYHKIKHQKGDRESFKKSCLERPKKDHKIEDGLWKVLFFPFVKGQHEKVNSKDVLKESSKISDPKTIKEKAIKDNLSGRSRISFSDPIEKIFEKMFGYKKHRDHKCNHKFKVRRNQPFLHDHGWGVPMQRPRKLHPLEKVKNRRKNIEFEDFERQYQMMWKQMRELEKSFFGDFY